MEVHKNYLDACATVRTDAISALRQSLASGHIDRMQVDYLTEQFIALLHTIPTWALEAIIERRREGR